MSKAPPKAPKRTRANDEDHEPSTASRRTFLGCSSLALVGAGLGLSAPEVKTAELRWQSERGFPDLDQELVVRLPKRPSGVHHARLLIETPREHKEIDLGPVALRRGEAVLTIPLRYPYESFVVGDYRYHVSIEGAQLSLRTSRPARFTVRPFVWFS